MRFNIIRSVAISRELGMSLIETAVVLAVLGTIAVVFLTGMAISSSAVAITDEHATAENLARSQMEWAQNASYAANVTGYSAATMPSDKDYINYSATISAQPLNIPDDGIQKITVVVTHAGEPVFTLESYKVNR